MKKAAIFMICLIVTFSLFVPCSAGYRCPSHNMSTGYYTENSDGSKSDPWYADGIDAECRSVNDKYHSWYQLMEYRCPFCDRLLGKQWELTYKKQEHTYYNGVCFWCGHERSGLPTGDELQAQALRQGKSVLNQTLSIVHNGNIRSGAGSAYGQVGTATTGQTFTVLDYTVVDGKYTWFKVNYGAGTAWISASLGEVDAYQDFGIDVSIYIGRKCKVTAVTANCRSDAGKSYPAVTSVKTGASFVILDAKVAKNGRPWFKIRVNNMECWISSGMVEVN